jgi:hypothetical protein
MAPTQRLLLERLFQLDPGELAQLSGCDEFLAEAALERHGLVGQPKYGFAELTVAGVEKLRELHTAARRRANRARSR